MIAEFQARFGSCEGIRMWRAPGRVNLIGEHTDYNLGFVLPVALQLATCVAAAPASDSSLHIYSESRQELRNFPLAELDRVEPEGHWTDYPIGVARELVAAGFAIEPMNLLIRSTVPDGAGLSSSAALEVSAALALLNGRTMAPLDLARLCQRAERDFVGLPCGIMDQYISLFGRDQSAIEIDCRSLEHRTVHLPDGINFVAVNTMVKHALSESAYRNRVHECAEAVAGMRRRLPWIESLRDVTPTQFPSASATLSDVIKRRAEHVVTENDRVGRFVQASERNDLEPMGTLLLESHRSLQYDYEVSCPELDFLVDTAIEMDGVFGARMTGGGFGGCTVNMLRQDAVERFSEDIARAYEAQFQVTPGIYECKPSGGAREATP